MDKDELQEQLDELIAHHSVHHDKETRFLQHIVDLETTVAYNEATIADLEAEIKRLTETELALMEELEEAA